MPSKDSVARAEARIRWCRDNYSRELKTQYEWWPDQRLVILMFAFRLHAAPLVDGYSNLKGSTCIERIHIIDAGSLHLDEHLIRIGNRSLDLSDRDLVKVLNSISLVC